MEISDYDAVGLAELVRSRTVSPSELLDHCIDVVEKRNPAINALVTPMYDEAKTSIRAGLPSGSFTGVPFLLKDLLADYAGVPTTCGSRFYESYTPRADSELVRRYKAAGLVIFGKTNTPEFGGSVTTEPTLHGPTRNPWDLERSAGGSSGGSGAAVASGMAPMAHGNDGGGSLRIPGSANGLFALKPSRARNPSGPVYGEHWNGLVEEHAITRSVRDSAVLLDATSGPDMGAPYRAQAPTRAFSDEVGADPGRLRIAYSTRSASGRPIDVECLRAVERTLSLCEDLGHHVVEDTPRFDVEPTGQATVMVIAVNYLLMVQARARELGREPNPDELESVIRQRIDLARRTTAADYAAAIQQLHRTGRQFGEFFERYDIHITPTLASRPLVLGELDMNSDHLDDYLTRLYEYIPFTGIYNVSGAPACSMPLHWSPDGLPVGVQAGAAVGNEAVLFRFASQLEATDAWSSRTPKWES